MRAAAWMSLLVACGGGTPSGDDTTTPGTDAATVVPMLVAPTASPGTLDFPKQGVGIGPSHAIVIANTSNVPVAISATVSDQFMVVNNGCSSQVAVGATCELGLAFAPSAAGPVTGAVTVVQGAFSIAVPLSGICDPSVEKVTPDPTAVTFGDVTVGAHGDLTINMRNDGVVSHPPPTLTFNGVDPDEFVVQTTTCTGPLASGTMCAITIRFKPLRNGEASANMTYEVMGISPIAIPLAGNGD